MAVNHLSVEEVLRIHEVVIRDFATSDDPAGDGGVRSQALLESAVGRQHSGFGLFKKYPDPVSNAASLTYGICNDHAFHNGNKRTALVSMLAHLDKNRLALKGEVRQTDLYEVMLALADHQLTTERLPRRTRERLGRARYSMDHQVEELTKWLRVRVSPVQRGERQITYRQLRQVLKAHGYVLGNVHSNLVEVCREVPRTRGVFRRETTTELKVIGRIGYRNDGETLGLKTIKQVRRMCNLTEEDGVDTSAFYEGAEAVDAFVNRYRTVLRRLAKT